MAWSIEFIPKEVDAISVNINNEHWVTWNSSQGLVRWLLPPKWVLDDNIHVYGAAIPRGKNASMKVFWDNENKQDMNFDEDEAHDVGH